MRDSKLFDQTTRELFEPIAQKLGLEFFRRKDGSYEIISPHFIVRIREDTGHRRGLNVLLRPSSFRNFDENQPGIEYGLGNVARFKGEEWQDALIENDSDFVKRAEWLGMMTERLAVPYLLGLSKDFDAVREMVKE